MVAEVLFPTVLNVFYVNWKSLEFEKHDSIYGDIIQEPSVDDHAIFGALCFEACVSNQVGKNGRGIF